MAEAAGDGKRDRQPYKYDLYIEEKDISAMTLNEILEIQGITVAEIGMINDLQKAIKANKVITFLGGGEL